MYMKRAMKTIDKATKSGAPAALKPLSSSPVLNSSNSTSELNEAEVNSLKMKISLLENDIERRQESYVTRESAYEARINELKEDLAQLRQHKSNVLHTERKVDKLKGMHHQILNNVDLVQDRTSRILQEQERDLLRAFRARLFDVQTELEKEKSKKDDGTSVWKEKSAKLESELNWAKEVTDRLGYTNQLLSEENHRLKSLYERQEEDRAFNIKQLVLVKKENAELKSRYEQLEKKRFDLEESAKGALDEKAALAQKTTVKLDSDDRFKEINKRLRKLLESERKNLQKERQSYQHELRTRTETELLLRQCVEDVRREISRVHLQAAKEAAARAGSEGGRPTHSPKDRHSSLRASKDKEDKYSTEGQERQLELLLSQERVVSLLYAKTFPLHTKQQQTNQGLLLNETDVAGNL